MHREHQPPVQQQQQCAAAPLALTRHVRTATTVFCCLAAAPCLCLPPLLLAPACSSLLDSRCRLPVDSHAMWASPVVCGVSGAPHRRHSVDLAAATDACSTCLASACCVGVVGCVRQDRAASRIDFTGSIDARSASRRWRRRAVERTCSACCPRCLASPGSAPDSSCAAEARKLTRAVSGSSAEAFLVVDRSGRGGMIPPCGVWGRSWGECWAMRALLSTGLVSQGFCAGVVTSRRVCPGVCGPRTPQQLHYPHAPQHVPAHHPATPTRRHAH
jgi:hypothetical protein